MQDGNCSDTITLEPTVGTMGKSKRWLRRSALWMITLGCVCPSVYASTRPGSAANYTGSPAAVAYVIGSDFTQVAGFSITGFHDSPTSVVTFPESYYGGPLATDSSGNVYVGVAFTPASPGPENFGEIFVYPPNPTGTTVPLRTIPASSYDLMALAVDATGQLYVATTDPTEILVYPADANGTTPPLRVIQPSGNLLVKDIAVDGSGNVYVAALTEDGGIIAVYGPNANGASTPDRVLSFGTYRVFGVAVDPIGDVFASVGSVDDSDYAIEEFGPGASGWALPVYRIKTPPSSIILSGGPVRIDGAGNIFTSVLIDSVPSIHLPRLVIYGFAPSARRDAVPTVRITLPGDNGPYFAVN
jgi:hypothetical protein